ncbi:LysR family transcriptional regulator [Rhodococcus sp. ARC_M6]|uniref:LysR family transcriptional regulator n=1 Tax=Rhodococcus sp. ARC_M6 TaxID=2928852 RepID=UPI001FB3E102|nr:LysR family transcriptional regulator [Rhodococcus sp. ARC_M6]MCJ0902464.1 LysR family transcriptional regulator [Rhodococcus sp. ARC_M6]
MRADDLVVLLEIARCGSLVGAASALGLNHATVSRRMSVLEAEIRAPLLVRGVSGCTLTDLGHSLLKSCEQIESALTEVRDLASTTPRERELSGLVRISTTDAFGTAFVAPLMAELHRTNPDLMVEIITQTRLGAYGIGADIEIGVGEPVVGRPGAEKLTDYRLGLYASDDYLAERGVPQTLAELAGHSLVYYIEGLLRVEDLDVLTRLTGHRQVTFGSTNVQVQTVATVAGAGIGLLPSFVAEREPSLRRVLPSEVVITLEFTACLGPRRLRRPAAATVMQAIREMVAERQDELMPH